MNTHDRNGLPNIFPSIGPATSLVLFSDFVEPALVTQDDWLNEIGLIVGQGMAGLARRLVHEYAIQLPRSVIELLQQTTFFDQSLTTRTLKCSGSGLQWLSEAEIPYVVTKGPGIALMGRSPSDRPFMDIDVVVAPARFSDALRLLRSTGYSESPLTMQTWDSFNLYCREAVNLRNEDGGSIDLHHRISPWYWSKGITFDLLQRDAIPVTMYGEHFTAVSPIHNLLITALHIVSDKSRPGQTVRAWRDLLVLVEKCPVASVVEAALVTGLIPWLFWILRCLPLDVQPAELLDALAGFDHRINGTSRLKMLMPQRIGAQHPIGQVFRIPLPHAVLYVAGMAMPSPTYLRTRYPDEKRRYSLWLRDSTHSFTKEAIASARPAAHKHLPPTSK